MHVSFPRNYRSRREPFTMLLQNNASREVFILDGLHNIAVSPLYYTFDLVMPDKAPAGEYTYYLTDVSNSITPNSQPLLSVVTLPDGTTKLLGDTKPEIGLFMYNTTDADPNIYPEKQKSFIYYDRK